MPRRDTRTSLAQMRDRAKEALMMAQGKTREDLDVNRVLNLSLVKLLEIVSEAVNRVPSEDRGQYPNMPWP